MVEEGKGVNGSALSIAEELRELGRQLSAALRTAWQSEERKELEREISEGLKALGDQIEEAVQTARDSEAVKGMQSDVRRAVETAREGEVLRNLKEGLAGSLRALNREIGDFSSSLEAKEKAESGDPTTEDSGEAAAEEPGAPE